MAFLNSLVRSTDMDERVEFAECEQIQTKGESK